ncbi:PepSY domain-containing protein, partial [Pseudomonas syringae pv. tagetis]
WVKRRPQRVLGVPPLLQDLPRLKMAIVVMISLGVIFPLVGISMVIVWVLDRLVLSRFAKSAATA